MNKILSITLEKRNNVIEVRYTSETYNSMGKWDGSGLLGEIYYIDNHYVMLNLRNIPILVAENNDELITKLKNKYKVNPVIK